MGSILGDLVTSRQQGVGQRPKVRSSNTGANETLRLVSMIVIAIAAWRYHSPLFDAAQPYFDRLYHVLKH